MPLYKIHFEEGAGGAARGSVRVVAFEVRAADPGVEPRASGRPDARAKDEFLNICGDKRSQNIVYPGTVADATSL